MPGRLRYLRFCSAAGALPAVARALPPRREGCACLRAFLAAEALIDLASSFLGDLNPTALRPVCAQIKGATFARKKHGTGRQQVLSLD